uniref:G domain-containing protein n=1 Tax=Quercus lobata TaxID=97700 RepID=A0A7N2R6Q4_QUELO
MQGVELFLFSTLAGELFPETFSFLSPVPIPIPSLSLFPSIHLSHSLSLSLSKRSLSHHISLSLNTKQQQRKENENEEDEPNVPIETINGLENCDEEEEDYALAIAIVGRPNIGKSSILNALVGEDRTIFSPISGTTHDAIDTEFTGSNGQLWLCHLWTALRM